MSFFKSFKDKKSSRDRQDMSSNTRSDQHHTDHKQVPLSTSSQPTHQQPETYAPPPGPPPSQASSEANPPPYESWLAVPDTSQLPPPPSSIPNEFSPTNNATYYSAEMGHRWCANHSIYTPSIPRNPDLIHLSHSGELGLDPPPPGFRGSIRQLDPRSWEIKTDKRQQDTILTSALPIYFAAVSNPLLPPSEHNPTPTSTTLSFSITISTVHAAAGIAIGFTCKPYPPFRLPGWHRGSLAVHSDDGNRYINDPWGGIDFVRPFQVNDTITLSATIHPQHSPVQVYRGIEPGVRRVGGNLPKCVVRIEMARNGTFEGAWDVHEERDAERDEGIEGLQGEADLYCAVGVFGATGFLVRFDASHA